MNDKDTEIAALKTALYHEKEVSEIAIATLKITNHRLQEQQRSYGHIAACLLQQAGGRVAIDDITTAVVPLDPSFISTRDEAVRKTIIKFLDA